MTCYIALLRAVNVGGTGKLPMSELRQLCESVGFSAVRTYIASGNVVFESPKTAAAVKAELEKALHTYAGKPLGVLVRTSTELAEVLAQNPFPDEAANRTVAIFLDEVVPAGVLEAVRGQVNEKIHPGVREIYVHYGAGMANSKLRIPAARSGTARNINTVAKLVAMTSAR